MKRAGVLERRTTGENAHSHSEMNAFLSFSLSCPCASFSFQVSLAFAFDLERDEVVSEKQAICHQESFGTDEIRWNYIYDKIYKSKH